VEAVRSISNSAVKRISGENI